MTHRNLRRLIEQFNEAQITLNSLRIESGCEVSVESVPNPSIGHESAYATAIRLFHNRRERRKHFGDREIFGEPGWDILLDIYIHQVRNERVSIKSASIGSGAPATTALRWLNVLEKEGLIYFEADPTDHRRRFVNLTPVGSSSMTAYLGAIVD